MTSTPVWTTIWLQSSLAVGSGLLVAGLLLCLVRAARGPHEPDRLAALALVNTLAVGLMAMLAIARADWRYLDIALVLSLVSGALPVAVGYAARARRTLEAPSQETDVTHAISD